MKKNHRPESILPNLSKLFEPCMHDQPTSWFLWYAQDINADFKKGLGHNIIY